MLLRLLQLADSALPIGTSAHSFGLETLAAESVVEPNNLGQFLRTILQETGIVEAAFLRTAYRIDFDSGRWIELNALMSARKPAREPRAASISLGRRFLALANELEPCGKFESALRCSAETHFATAFGIVARHLEIPEEPATLAFLQQSITGLVSACTRLMPLGQTAAMRIVWSIQPVIAEVAEESRNQEPGEVSSFAPMVEIAGMRHPGLETRLFVS